MCLWFAEDRGQWVVSPPELLGDSKLILARITSRSWWPWEAHLGGTTSPACFGSAPFSVSPPWQSGAKLLGASCKHWETATDFGTFVEARGMIVKATFEPRLRLSASESARFPFLGAYEMAGLLSSRPFYRQVPGTLPEAAQIEARSGIVQAPLYAVWYSEEHQSWAVSAEFRLLDHASAEARVSDSAWVPWDTVGLWEIPDAEGGFIADPSLSAVLMYDEEPLVLERKP